MVNFLLDTNVISEWTRPLPEPLVVDWLAGADEDGLYLSVISLAELRRGVELLPTGRRRQQLASWLADDLTTRFEDRILAIDVPVADAWGRVMVAAQSAGITLDSMDGWLAATAQVHDLVLVTRNSRDFDRLDMAILNPWLT